MTDATTLLPANASRAERALATAVARISDVPMPHGDVWNPTTCPAALLPWLAWALSVDDWDEDWPEAVKRDVIRRSAEVHRLKGTRAGVRLALDAAGYGDAEIVEKYNANTHDGTHLRDGSITYAATDHWSEYRVILARIVTNAQAARVRSILGNVAPVRSRLKALDFTRALAVHDGSIRRDGTFNYGIA
jgi:phage tail P2-like protein